jgi:uncharacterized protein
MPVETHRVPVVENQCICLDWYPSEPGAPAAMFVHGLGSNRRGEKASYFADRCNQQGWAFAALDLRGHGEADGCMRNLRVDGMLADIHAARQWVTARGVAADPILIGSSMGAAMIAWYVLEWELLSPLVFIAPSLDFPRRLAVEIGADGQREWEQRGVRKWTNRWIDVELGSGLIVDGEKYNAAELVRAHRSPTLIIHGMADDVVSWRDSATFALQCPAPVVDLLLCKEGDHRLTDRKDYLFSVIWSWVQRIGTTHAAQRRRSA